MWHAEQVTPDDLTDLVPAWLTLPDVAERIGRSVTAVRRLIEDGELIAVRVGERAIVSVPEAFIGPDGPLPALKGTFTVLADGGLDQIETVHWLFTPDPALPVGRTPIEAIRAGHKTEVRRRAMEIAL